METVERLDLPNCVRLTNGEIEIIAATDVGPRIIAYKFVGGENVLGETPEAKISTALGEFRLYGGHRLWIAPENMPNSYAPDNAPVEYSFDETANSLHLIQPLETVTNTQKEMTISLEKEGSGVVIHHKITNRGARSVELSAWALTVMRGGGVCEIPNEPFAPYGGETLLPVRNLAVWSYTDFSDPRWSFDREFLRLRVDAAKPDPQKIGVLNKQGWTRYAVENLVFTKHYEYIAGETYPDMNSNTELYTAGSFVEIESLSPLATLAPNEAVEHVERWRLETV